VLTAVLTSVQKNPDDDPCSCISNDVAYYLADADVELPLADKTARQDVEQTSRETRSWTLEDNSMLLRNRSLDLFNYWIRWAGFYSARIIWMRRSLYQRCMAQQSIL